VAKRKRKPRRNAGKVISLAAFRKKGQIEEPSDEPDEPETPGRSHAEMKERGELWWQGGQPGGPTTSEEVDERMAAMRDAMRVKRNLTRLLKVTQRVFSPSTVKRYLPIVAEYDDGTLRRFAFESTEKQWLEKPSFFRAVMREAADRWGMFAPKDNPEESVTMKWTKKSKHEWRAAHEEVAFRIVRAPREAGRFLVMVFDSDWPDGVPLTAWDRPSLSAAKQSAQEALQLAAAGDSEGLAKLVAPGAEGNPKKKATKKKSRKKAPKRRRPSTRETAAKQAEIRRLFPDETGEIMASWVGLEQNPNTTEHRETAQKLSRAAGQALESAQTSAERGRPWQEGFNSYLNALVWAMAAHREAEYGMPKRKEGRRQRKGARRMAWAVEDTERHVLKIADSAVRGLRQMVRTAADQGRGEGFLAASDHPATANPANIPGGNMTECIAIMEARGDVESPGALCNWLSQKAGGQRGSARAAGRAGRRKKVSDTLRRAMRGT